VKVCPCVSGIKFEGSVKVSDSLPIALELHVGIAPVLIGPASPRAVEIQLEGMVKVSDSLLVILQ
jgi:hypothetical protein